MKLSHLTPAVLLASALLVGTAGSASADPGEQGTEDSPIGTSLSLDAQHVEDMRQAAALRGSRAADLRAPLNTIKVSANAEWSIDTAPVKVVPSGKTVFKDNLKEYVPQLNKEQRKEYEALVDKREEKKRLKAEVKAEAKRVKEEETRQAEEQRNLAEVAPQSSSPQKSSPKKSKSSRPAAPSAAVPSGTAQQIAHGMMGAQGWGEGEFSCLVNLWNKESGWNHKAQNPSSGAFGIPQSLPASKMASAGSDYLTNPATQIKWGIGYIKGRYGTPCGAWGHSQQVGWY